MNNDELNQYRNRLIVSELIFDVLCDKKTVAQALSLFPHQRDDINLKCAFDALCYREADEKYRKKVRDYALVQDEYLEFIATALKKNEPLPKNVIQKYLKYNKDNLIGDYDTSFKNIIKQIKRFINF